MAILSSHIHLICRELQEHPVRGTALTLGNLKVVPTFKSVTSILAAYGLRPPAPHLSDAAMGGAALLKALGAEEVSALDVDAYEGADLLWNLNDPVSPCLNERFDFILDGGTLEHVFDLPQALDSIGRMTKIGGAIVLMTPASNSVDHGFYSVSPTLLFDYFSANGFGMLSCYLAEVCSYDYSRPVTVYRYPYVSNEYRMSSDQTVYTIFFATKLEASRCPHVKPIQSLYTSLHATAGSDRRARSPLERRCRDLIKHWAPRRLLAPVVERQRRSGLQLVGRW
jgi:hypothetical protein